MLSFGAFGEGCQFFLGRRLVDQGGPASFAGAFLSADRAGDDGTNDLLKRGAVVGGDPFGELEKFGRDEGFGVDEIGEVAKGKVAFGSFVHAKNGAGGRPVAEGDANATAGEDFKLVRNGVVKDEFGWSVDENAGGKRHRAAPI